VPDISLRELRMLCTALTQNTHVVSLGLSGKLSSEGAAYVAKLIKENQRIDNLALISSAIGPEGAGVLASALFSSSLKTLILAGNHIGSGGVASLVTAMKQTFGLVAMSVSSNGVDDDGLEALSMLLRQGNAQMQWLGLDHNRFSLSGIRGLASTLRINRTLRYLNLANCKLGPAELSCLAESIGGVNGNDRLEYLGLGGNRADSDSCAAIRDLLMRQSHSLAALNLSACFLSLDHARVLSPGIAASRTLSSLFLSHNRLNDDAIALLVDALLADDCCSSLRRLDVSHNLFGRDGLLRLVKLLRSRLLDGQTAATSERAVACAVEDATLGSEAEAADQPDSTTPESSAEPQPTDQCEEPAPDAERISKPFRGPLFQLINIEECTGLRNENRLVQWFYCLHRCSSREDPLFELPPSPPSGSNQH